MPIHIHPPQPSVHVVENTGRDSAVSAYNPKMINKAALPLV